MAITKPTKIKQDFHCIILAKSLRLEPTCTPQVRLIQRNT